MYKSLHSVHRFIPCALFSGIFVQSRVLQFVLFGTRHSNPFASVVMSYTVEPHISFAIFSLPLNLLITQSFQPSSLMKKREIAKLENSYLDVEENFKAEGMKR